MDYNIASVLKQLRKTSGQSASEVISRLKEYKIEISTKTLYGYESGLSMPNANVFVALCRIYDCDNPMDLFGNNAWSQEELQIVKKYRFISQHSPEGVKTVDYILDREYAIAEQLQQYGQISNRPIITLAEYEASKAPTYLIPYWENGVSAGNGIYQLNDTNSVMINLWATELTRQVDFIIKVSGHSMEPDYNDGDKVLVNRDEVVMTGEVGIFVKNGDTFIKELGEGELISRNPEYDNIAIHDLDNVVCMGKVIGILRNDMIAED